MAALPRNHHKMLNDVTNLASMKSGHVMGNVTVPSSMAFLLFLTGGSTHDKLLYFVGDWPPCYISLSNWNNWNAYFLSHKELSNAISDGMARTSRQLHYILLSPLKTHDLIYVYIGLRNWLMTSRNWSKGLLIMMMMMMIMMTIWFDLKE